MAQKKTVFERLEDKMIELEANVDAKLSKVQAAIETLKDDIPRSIGQNLMSFTDILGAKVEDLEDLIKNMGGSGGSAPDLGAINSLKNGLNEIKVGMNDLKNSIQNIKSQAPSTVAPTPAPSSIPRKPSPAAPASPPPVSKPPTKPVSAPKSSAKPKPASAPSPAPADGAMGDVFNLLDTIKTKANSGITATQLATEMELIRDTIVKIFRWHPALYELATFARRLKKYPQGSGLDAEILNLLLEKVEEWKNRINS